VFRGKNQDADPANNIATVDFRARRTCGYR
jgi:hypothetical protein